MLDYHSARFRCVSTLASVVLITHLLRTDYTTAGEFTCGGRLKYAIRLNMRIYLVGGALFLVGILIVATQNRLSSDETGFLLACIANVFGLVLVVVLLGELLSSRFKPTRFLVILAGAGYGVVELPRSLWRQGADRRVRLQRVLSNLPAHANDVRL